MSENVTTDDKPVHSKSHVCCTCGRALDPEQDAVVYLGYSERHDGKPGPGWVAALCAPTPEQMTIGSPCVAACRQWADTNGVDLIPATLADWLGESDDDRIVLEHGGRRCHASLTTEHSASSYGQPVVVLPDGDPLGTTDWQINGWQLVEATPDQRAELRNAGYPVDAEGVDHE